MTQRIFDAKNEKDIKELFGFFPDYIIKFEKGKEVNGTWIVSKKTTEYFLPLLQINWHDLTEIKRPVDYSKYIGVAGHFWGNSEIDNIKGFLGGHSDLGYHTEQNFGRFKYFRPLTKKEAEKLIYKED